MKSLKFVICVIFAFTAFSIWAKPTITIGSKNFTESYVLAEIVAQIVESTGEAKAHRSFGMAGTGIAFAALENGEIDIYPEYSGTISRVIIKQEQLNSIEQLNGYLSHKGLQISKGLGFNNTYALGIKQSLAVKHNIKSIGDLKAHSHLHKAFSYEFLKRQDGLPGLIKTYGLSNKNIQGMEHGLAYEAIGRNEIQIMDIYTTDGKIKKYDLIPLIDDKNYFPQYYGVWFVKNSFPKRFPRTWQNLVKLEGVIDDQTMTNLNAMAELDKMSFSDIATAFLNKNKHIVPPIKASKTNTGDSKWFSYQMWVLTYEHFWLVFISLAISVFIGLPMGLLAQKSPRLGQFVLLGSGLLQTIPSLALLCFLIPFLGIGTLPSIVALCLYALLPIIRNTYIGFSSVDKSLSETSRVMGLSPFQRFRYVELPMASINIMTGIKTSAVVNVGMATLAAFIGAGGYGTLITTGLALNDVSIILKGAIPSALMAVGVHYFFELLDRVLIPKGLRLSKNI